MESATHCSVTLCWELPPQTSNLIEKTELPLESKDKLYLLTTFALKKTRFGFKDILTGSLLKGNNVMDVKDFKNLKTVVYYP